MRLQLKYALPLAQMILALLLLWCSDLWFKAAIRIWDSPGIAPPHALLVSMNAPVSLARLLWRDYVPSSWDYAILIAAIGLFWYWVALNILSWHQRRTAFIFSWTRLRLAGDALLIAVGVFFGFDCLGPQFGISSFRNSFPPHLVGWLWFVACVTLYLAWSLVLIFFFGRDLIHCLLRKKPLTARPIQR